MAIHEKSLIRPENLLESDKELVIDGVDVTGHWSTFIEPRVVTDYNEAMEDEIQSLPGGEKINRCWQCGSCTNSCTVNAINPDFNPRYWIYLIRMGMESEILRDKEIIWQCVSCNKCTYVCPREVEPEGVMKATAHWLELKGHTKPSPSSLFDAEFADQVINTGKIEEGRIIRGFFKRTGQPLAQDWLIEMAKRIARKLPVKMGIAMGLQALIRPKTKNWDSARDAIKEYVDEREQTHRRRLQLDELIDQAQAEVDSPTPTSH
jgi:heterodisulfide reductase subunit C